MHINSKNVLRLMLTRYLPTHWVHDCDVEALGKGVILEHRRKEVAWPWSWDLPTSEKDEAVDTGPDTQEKKYGSSFRTIAEEEQSKLDNFPSK